ncbi:Cellulose biosynthesis protein BcsS [Rhabdaerophilaceae bacterium]
MAQQASLSLASVNFENRPARRMSHRSAVALFVLCSVPILPMPDVRSAEKASTSTESSLSRAFTDKQKGVFFANLSASQWNLHLGTGTKFAPLGTRDEAGWRLMLTSGTKFRERDPLIAGRFNRSEGGRVLAGYEGRIGNMTVSAFAGASLSVASPFEQGLTNRASRFGAVGLLEVWQNWPSRQQIPSGFTAATVLVDSAEGSAFFRVRHGVDLGFHGIAIGPELSISAGEARKWRSVTIRDNWLKARAGLHIHGLRLGRLGLSVSGGYEFRRGEKGSPYGELTTLWFY